MSQDRVSEAIDRVEDAAVKLHEAVDAVAGELVRARERRCGGASMTEVVQQLLLAGGRELRLSPAEAAADFERAITAYRVAAIEQLVDSDGMTFTQIAAMTGVSRQMVARLYRGGQASPNG